MVYNIHLTNEAKQDIKKASTYYLKISSDLNDKFTSDLIKTIDGLKENPLHHRVRYRGIRIAHTKTFSFGIHFIIDEKIITILNILHHKQFYK